MGKYTTPYWINLRLCWPKMKNYIKYWIKTCVRCNITNHWRRRGSGLIFCSISLFYSFFLSRFMVSYWFRKIRGPTILVKINIWYHIICRLCSYPSLYFGNNLGFFMQDVCQFMFVILWLMVVLHSKDYLLLCMMWFICVTMLLQNVIMKRCRGKSFITFCTE